MAPIWYWVSPIYSDLVIRVILHNAVRLAMIAEQTLFRHEHKLDHNERCLLVQDRSQVQLASVCLAIEPVVPARVRRRWCGLTTERLSDSWLATTGSGSTSRT